MANTAILKVTVLQDSRGGWGNVTSDMQRLGQAATRTAAVVGGTLAVGAYKAVQAASDLGESTNAVQQVFGDASRTITDFGANAANSAGISQAAFQQLATQTGSLLINVGYNADQAADSTVNLGQRAADMASVFNTDVDQALQAINAGLRGETEPLRQFGVNLTDASLKAQALEMGIYDGVGALDQHQKALAAEALILEQTAATAGDFGNTQDSVANRTRTLQATMTDLAASLGETLLPYAESLLGVFQGMVTWISENETAFKAMVGTVAAVAGGILALNAIIKTARAVMAAYRAIIVAVRVAKIVWITVQTALNIAMIANPIGLIIAAIVALIAIITTLVIIFKDDLIRWMKKAWEWVKKGATWLRDKLGAAFQWVSDKISGVVSWLKDAYEWIKNVLNSGVEKITGWFGGGSRALAAGTAGVGVTGGVAASRTSARNTGTVVNISGQIIDPDGVARQMRGVLNGSARRGFVAVPL